MFLVVVIKQTHTIGGVCSWWWSSNRHIHLVLSVPGGGHQTDTYNWWCLFLVVVIKQTHTIGGVCSWWWSSNRHIQLVVSVPGGGHQTDTYNWCCLSLEVVIKQTGTIDVVYSWWWSSNRQALFVYTRAVLDCLRYHFVKHGWITELPPFVGNGRRYLDTPDLATPDLATPGQGFRQKKNYGGGDN